RFLRVGICLLVRRFTHYTHHAEESGQVHDKKESFEIIARQDVSVNMIFVIVRALFKVTTHGLDTASRMYTSTTESVTGPKLMKIIHFNLSYGNVTDLVT
ncbi:Hypothetical predicted protein, partial [Paramuricea clavata]